MALTRGYQRAVFGENTASDHEVVAAPSADNQRIRVRGGFLSAAGTVVATIKSGTTVLGAFNLSAGPGVVLPPTEGGVGEAWLECAANEALNITLNGAVQTDGVIFYDIVTKGA